MPFELKNVVVIFNHMVSVILADKRYEFVLKFLNVNLVHFMSYESRIGHIRRVLTAITKQA